MSVFDLFSKRRKRERGEVSDVFITGPIPQEFRIQVVHIWHDVIGEVEYRQYSRTDEHYTIIRNALCREYGKFFLSQQRVSEAEDLINWFLQTPSDEEVLDAIELSFQFIEGTCDHFYKQNYGTNIVNDDAVKELNARFLEKGLGYQFEGAQIIPFSSKFIHEAVVKNALVLISNQNFSAVDTEFRAAFEHYRHGRSEETIVSALKSFESMMKTICSKNSWPYDSKDTARNLIQILIDNSLIPPELKAPLESGLPPIRNKLAGHGAGTTPRTVSQEVAAYALHLAASNIVLLGSSDISHS